MCGTEGGSRFTGRAGSEHARCLQHRLPSRRLLGYIVVEPPQTFLEEERLGRVRLSVYFMTSWPGGYCDEIMVLMSGVNCILVWWQYYRNYPRLGFMGEYSICSGRDDSTVINSSNTNTILGKISDSRAAKCSTVSTQSVNIITWKFKAAHFHSYSSSYLLTIVYTQFSLGDRCHLSRLWRAQYDITQSFY